MITEDEKEVLREAFSTYPAGINSISWGCGILDTANINNLELNSLEELATFGWPAVQLATYLVVRDLNGSVDSSKVVDAVHTALDDIVDLTRGGVCTEWYGLRLSRDPKQFLKYL